MYQQETYPAIATCEIKRLERRGQHVNKMTGTLIYDAVFVPIIFLVPAVVDMYAKEYK
jgi:hypothetical protein